MKEDFLHYIWRSKQFDLSQLKTTQGQTLEIIEFGSFHHDSGPDFIHARIKINGQFWAGNVEMHLLSSEWEKHQHDQDPNYETVILHVVLEEDHVIYHRSGKRIPCLEMKTRISSRLLSNYKKLLMKRSWVPCQSQLGMVPRIKKHSMLDRMLVERLEEKTATIQALLIETKQDWENVLYRTLARNFGFKTNSTPFERLAQNIPLKILQKHKDQLLHIEALLFGAAGMLNRIFTDKYPLALQREFHHFENKYQLKCLDISNWKWMRMRPSNFPSIRISQFARVIYDNSSFFSKIIGKEDNFNLGKMLEVQASEYWDHHYLFEKLTSKRVKKLGAASIQIILINTVAPFLFLYGRKMHEPYYVEKALSLLSSLSPEQNYITKKWKKAGMPNTTAAQSQGLLQLKKYYCANHKCLHCSIGNHLLTQPSETNL